MRKILAAGLFLLAFASVAENCSAQKGAVIGISPGTTPTDAQLLSKEILAALPPLVQKALGSVVGVSGVFANSTGVVFADHRVLANHHTVAVWKGGYPTLQTAIGPVHVLVDGKSFPAKIIAAEPKNDMVLLQVFDLPDCKFNKKSAIFDPTPIPQKDNSGLFSFKVSSKFSESGAKESGIEQVFYVTAHDLFDGYRKGKVIFRNAKNGFLKKDGGNGFSGSCTFDGHGYCRGIVFASAPVGWYTAFIPADQAIAFLKRHGVEPLLALPNPL